MLIWEHGVSERRLGLNAAAPIEGTDHLMAHQYENDVNSIPQPLSFHKETGSGTQASVGKPQNLLFSPIKVKSIFILASWILN